MDMAITNTINGLIILNSDKPLDLRAVSSLFSEKLPKVIRDEIKMANGSARGMRLAET